MSGKYHKNLENFGENYLFQVDKSYILSYNSS